tara:strand:+ start:1193 stop:1636 length:444 start_codon:yes stop_codon:yes gene_type:complete
MFKDECNTKEDMKKNFYFLLIFTLFSGCYGSVAFLGPASTTAASGAGGNIARGAFTSSVSYGVKKQTGKLPIEHALAFADEKNPNKKKEPCLSFAEKTNSEICTIVKKQLKLTKSKILKKSKEKFIKDHTSSIQPKISKNSQIKYLD